MHGGINQKRDVWSVRRGATYNVHLLGWVVLHMMLWPMIFNEMPVTVTVS